MVDFTIKKITMPPWRPLEANVWLLLPRNHGEFSWNQLKMEVRRYLRLNTGDRARYHKPFVLWGQGPDMQMHIDIKFASKEAVVAFNLAHATAKRETYGYYKASHLLDV